MLRADGKRVHLSTFLFYFMVAGFTYWSLLPQVDTKAYMGYCCHEAHHNGGGGERQDRRDIPCKGFNSHLGCINPRSHQGRNVNFIHACSLCFSQVGDRAPHPAVGCPRGQRSTQAVNMPIPRAYTQQATPVFTPKNASGACQQKMRPVGSDSTN